MKLTDYIGGNMLDELESLVDLHVDNPDIFRQDPHRYIEAEISLEADKRQRLNRRQLKRRELRKSDFSKISERWDRLKSCEGLRRSMGQSLVELEARHPLLSAIGVFTESL
ncbi:hypothetical protein KUV57_12280 [Epibacterium sp. DP7N7-1]|nr:hypothetical protein [Epibacterium sp. DP7N7-1]